MYSDNWTEMNSMPLKVVALVSVGRHPVSGRPRRAPLDARAVELGLRMCGAALQLLHAGDPEAAPLRDYLGMGIAAVQVLHTAAGQDIVPALTERLRESQPHIILAGAQAEGGEDSGLVPYLLATRLRLPVVANAVELTVNGDQARVRQALPRGRRREVEVALPCVVTVGHGAPVARAGAHGPAQRGRILVTPCQSSADERLAHWQEAPARARSKRIRVARGGKASDRMTAATAVVSSGGAVLRPQSPQEAARAILDYLRQVGLR